MRVVPDIPVVYPNKFPKDFVNDVAWWGSFPKKTLQANIGKLLSLDIDFGDRCSLSCPHCFRRDNKVDLGAKELLSYDEILDVVKQGKKLGLRSVKFLGAGEPFEDKRFLEFLTDLKKLGINSSIFTKGHIIGDTESVSRLCSSYGISTGEKLVEELNDLGVSILLGFNSFDTIVQDRMVGGVEGYTIKRNRALELLVDAGFNRHNPTHLCLIPTPITNSNYAEVPEIYKWARVRNLYVVACPPMVSGRCADLWPKITPSVDALLQLYTQIYRFNIESGIQTLQQIKEEGLSSYAGVQPCNQVACGMYVTLTGKVLRCPGDDVTVFGDVRKEPLEDIWRRSENYGRSGTFNCGCPPKFGKTIPHSLFTDVLLNLEKECASNSL